MQAVVWNGNICSLLTTTSYYDHIIDTLHFMQWQKYQCLPTTRQPGQPQLPTHLGQIHKQKWTTMLSKLRFHLLQYFSQLHLRFGEGDKGEMLRKHTDIGATGVLPYHNYTAALVLKTQTNVGMILTHQAVLLYLKNSTEGIQEARWVRQKRKWEIMDIPTKGSEQLVQ